MSIKTEIARLQNAKSSIKAAIEGKGVIVPDNAKLDGMAALIDAISSGGGSSSETWVLNSYGHMTSSFTGISFVSNGETFSSITYDKRGFMAQLLYDNTAVCGGSLLSDEGDGDSFAWESSMWVNNAYRKLTFSTPPSGDLLTWLETYAVKQANDTAVQTDKALTITSNGTTEITPDVPYDAMSKVTVTTIGATEPYREETLRYGYVTSANLHGYSVIPAYAFYHSYMASFDFPTGITGIHEYAFYQCQYIKSITVPAGVTFVGRAAFSLCYGLKSATLPDGIINMNDECFMSCTHLTSITIPDSVTHIGAYAFKSCTSLTSIAIPGSVTTIDQQAFRSCTSLTSITIPGSVTTISWGLCHTCSNLSSVTIQDGVTKVKDSAFQSCTSLHTVTFEGTPQSISTTTFNGCSQAFAINVPWVEGAVSGAPWGATNATINYNYTGG